MCTRILESCGRYVSGKQSSLTHWHPVLGWFAQPPDQNLQAAIIHMKHQLRLLWNAHMVQSLLGKINTAKILLDKFQCRNYTVADAEIALGLACLRSRVKNIR